jgi:hypothetical protein
MDFLKFEQIKKAYKVFYNFLPCRGHKLERGGVMIFRFFGGLHRFFKKGLGFLGFLGFAKIRGKKKGGSILRFLGGFAKAKGIKLREKSKEGGLQQ